MVKPLYFSLILGWTLALCLLFAPAAHADSSAVVIAHRHWQAIAQGDVMTLMGDYSPDAVFHWKEGAFEGDHVGIEAIRIVWIKFARVRSPLTLTVQNLQEKSGSHGRHIVTADVILRNADWTYPLAYRLVFRGSQIVEETWQLAESESDPGLSGA